VTADEIEQVRAGLSAAPRLRAYQVDARGQGIVVHEPHGAYDVASVRRTVDKMGGAAHRTLERLPLRYTPVPRFVRSDADTRTFTAHRWW